MEPLQNQPQDSSQPEITHEQNAAPPAQPAAPESFTMTGAPAPGQTQAPVEVATEAPVEKPVLDRSHLQSVYPSVDKADIHQDPVSPAANFASSDSSNDYTNATTDFNDLITLISGVASSTSYIIIFYLVKNLTATFVIGGILALVAIVFAFKTYKATGKMSPLSVIGLSAATISIVNIGSLLMAQAVLKSALHSLY